MRAHKCKVEKAWGVEKEDKLSFFGTQFFRPVSGSNFKTLQKREEQVVRLVWHLGPGSGRKLCSFFFNRRCVHIP